MSTTTTDPHRLRSLATVLSIGGLALFGVTACDEADDATEEDPAVEEDAEEDVEEEEDAED